MAGLLAYASYLPGYRLGPDSGVRAQRVVASFDEDSTTMAVAAASTLGSLDAGQILFATSTPAYLDKTNASALVAALRLPSDSFAADHIGTARSTFAALRAAVNGGGLVAAADVRIGKPGSSDERGGGDGGAALLFGDGPTVADVLAITSATTEVLDRWRSPRSLTGEQWEERFGFEEYADLVRETAAGALASAGLEEADHVLVTSGNSAITKRAGSLVKGRISTGSSPIGFSGAADPLVALAGVLDVAGPGETVLLLSAVDGCDALVLRTTAEIVNRRQPRPLSEQLASGRQIPYPTYLSWRGLLEREMPRRPEPDRPAGPPSARGTAWKFGFAGSRCTTCGFGHLPPIRVCRQCGATDQMELLPASTLGGRVATFTVDRLAYSPSPPVIDVVVDFDGGGRCALEVADADPASIEVGTRVELTFRTLFTAGNVHNYFWKARAV